MSRSFDGSTNYLEHGAAVVTDYPFSVMAWVKINSFDAHYHTFFALTSNAAGVSPTNNYQARLGCYGDGRVWLTAGDGSASTDTNLSSPTLSTGTWSCVVGVWTSSTSRTIHFGGSSNTGTTSRALSNLDTTNLGRTHYNISGFLQPLNGNLANVAVWNTALASGDVTLLRNGSHPFKVSPSSLVAYWPMTANVDPETSLVGTYDMTVNGATYSSDDPALSRINPGPVRARTQAVVGRAATR